MKIERTVSVETEVVINLDADDLRALWIEGLDDVPSSEMHLKRVLGQIGQWIMGIPDDLIKKMSDDTRSIVVRFYREQLERFLGFKIEIVPEIIMNDGVEYRKTDGEVL